MTDTCFCAIIRADEAERRFSIPFFVFVYIPCSAGGRYRHFIVFVAVFFSKNLTGGNYDITNQTLVRFRKRNLINAFFYLTNSHMLSRTFLRYTRA